MPVFADRRRGPLPVLSIAALGLAAALALPAAPAAAQSSATPAQPAPPQPNITRTEDFRDWKLVCGTPPGNASAPEQCHLLQSVVVSETKRRILQAEVGDSQDGRILALTVPLGIYLPAGIEISIDGGEKMRIPVDVCQPNGCAGAVKLDNAMLNRMKNGSRAVITFKNVQLKPIDVPLSLLGFTAGYAQVK
ncbi:MAG: invasion associated locus B family protein [Alphaproteobacteria bacterium]|nr:invasion associated locus B family protein [Alphaproteobacteria bacterium]MDX5368911.1 invasion associated locus B family protein [Alphaproteobacteria bacterium]MDX5463635.1 invasion associated locus B family protein [Alphaproteobacteria bacterium]